jgi:hypothetical protein
LIVNLLQTDAEIVYCLLCKKWEDTFVSVVLEIIKFQNLQVENVGVVREATHQEVYLRSSCIISLGCFVGVQL